VEKFIRVNMTDLTISEKQAPAKYRYLGGRALTSQIILDEVIPNCEPLGEFNKLVIAPGLLGGTTLSSSGRISIGAKSPLTGGIKESNGGGNTAQKLAKMGFKAIIVEGLAENDKFLLVIEKTGAHLVPAGDCASLGTYKLVEKLRETYHGKAGIIAIGPAGEMSLAAAGITNTDKDGNPSRYCGRGGLGAVMGSKGLKAIILDDRNVDNVNYDNESEFKRLASELNKNLQDNNVVKTYRKYGTPAILDLVQELGGLPTKNFSQGKFDRADKISGEAMYDTIIARGGKGKPSHSCMPGCLIGCSSIYPDSNGEVLVAPLEYETIGLMGSNLVIDDLDAIARMNYLCNDYGLDTIEIGAALGVAMQAGLAEFGDSKAAEQMVREIGKGTVLGRMFGSGAAIVGKIMGITRVPTVKGQAMPAYDPRAVKGNGVTYATSPMGADHTSGNCIRGKNPHSPEGQVDLSANSQKMMAAYDSLGLCVFVGAAFNSQLEKVEQLVATKAGKEAIESFLEFGEAVLKSERKFNQLAGLSCKDDRLPEYMKYEKLGPNNLVFDVSDGELDSVGYL